jgi:probable rRNA maturation factor
MLTAARRTDRELSILLCDRREMSTLHASWLGKRGPTDVLSFPQSRGPLGDVVLCVPVLRANARRYGWSLLTEATRMLAHGILHLCGRDHRTPTQERRMEREARVLVGAVEKRRSATE